VVLGAVSRGCAGDCFWDFWDAGCGLGLFLVCECN